MTEQKIKPCPFCGNEPTIVIRKGKDGWRDRYSVLCDYEHGGCGAESGWYHYEVEAISSWNKRVQQRVGNVKIRCDDCKFVENCVDYGWKECRKFTPTPHEPLTNEEWLRSCTTEQLAEFLYDIAYFDNWSDAIMNDSLINETAVEDAIEKWLKQPHREE